MYNPILYNYYYFSAASFSENVLYNNLFIMEWILLFNNYCIKETDNTPLALSSFFLIINKQNKSKFILNIKKWKTNPQNRKQTHLKIISQNAKLFCNTKLQNFLAINKYLVSNRICLVNKDHMFRFMTHTFISFNCELESLLILIHNQLSNPGNLRRKVNIYINIYIIF